MVIQQPPHPRLEVEPGKKNGKTSSCLSLAGGLQYITLTNCMYRSGESLQQGSHKALSVKLIMFVMNVLYARLSTPLRYIFHYINRVQLFS